MPNKIRFVHRTLTSGQHAITSPDVQGFCIVAATPQEAFNQAVEMLALIRGLDNGGTQEIVAAVEFQAA